MELHLIVCEDKNADLCLGAGLYPEAFSWMLSDKGKLFLMSVGGVWLGCNYPPAWFSMEEQGTAG